MRLIVTGGGTGGHVYPALEVARLAGEQGAELIYFGSLRGQEGKLCDARGILFKGFPSEPLVSLKTARGWKALSKLLRSRGLAKTHLKAARPDVVFSTGGYSAGPVVAAASALGIPYVIHESNSIPGRVNRMFGKRAASFLTVFFATERFYKDRPVIRTGQPIRAELRAAAVECVGGSSILVLGGSQGSAYLNEAVPQAVQGIDADVIHAAGPNNFAQTKTRVDGMTMPKYRVEPYLQTDALMEAYCAAGVAVCRSGGTLAELAMFGIPGVLVPLPNSADDHQLHNAREFEEMGVATVVEQERPPFANMRAAIDAWMGDEQRRQAAKAKLKEWDVPDATARILAHVEAAATGSSLGVQK